MKRSQRQPSSTTINNFYGPVGSVDNKGSIGNEAGQVGGSQQQGNEVVNHATPDKKPVPEPQSFQELLPNEVGLEMVYIPGGSFLMGSPEDEGGRFNCEGPQHQVMVPAFYMGKYPVTQAQWREVATLPQIEQELAPTPSNFLGDNYPVEQVNWDDAVEFCRRLSQHTGKNYRLPSEAEWEYACRAGTTTSFYFGDTLTPDLAKCKANLGMSLMTIFSGETVSVGNYPPNSFGLHDMHGNVWEWCEDIWHKDYNNGAPTDGSSWIEWGDTNRRVLRGGSWDYYPERCRSAHRFNGQRCHRYLTIGFRVVCVPPSRSVSAGGRIS